MKKVFWCFFSVLLGICFFFSAPLSSDEKGPPDKKKWEVTKVHPLGKIFLVDIYDNDSYDAKFQSLWGFACVIKVGGKTILFDTGGKGRTLMANLKRAKLEAKQIDAVFLSHNHGDHTKGLWYFLRANPNVTVYVPYHFPRSFKLKILAYKAKIIQIKKKPQEIFPGVFSTGVLGRSTKEQSMVVITDKGLLVINGCSHPGILKILTRCREMFPGRPIYLAVGGMHLLSTPKFRLKKIIEQFRLWKVEKVAPSHCTGARAKSMFQKEYKTNYLQSGVGRMLIK